MEPWFHADPVQWVMGSHSVGLTFWGMRVITCLHLGLTNKSGCTNITLTCLQGVYWDNFIITNLSFCRHMEKTLTNHVHLWG